MIMVMVVMMVAMVVMVVIMVIMVAMLVMPESRWPPGAMVNPGALQGPATAAAIPCQPGIV